MNNHAIPQNLTTRRLAAELLHEWALRDIVIGLGMHLTISAPSDTLTEEDRDALESCKSELIQALQTEWLDAELAKRHDLALWCAPRRAPGGIATPWLLPYRRVIERALTDALPSGSVQATDYVLGNVRQAVLDVARLIEAISRITRGRSVPPSVRSSRIRINF